MIPGAKDQYIPQLESTFKIMVLLSLMLGSFELMNSIGIYYENADLHTPFYTVVFAVTFMLLAVFVSMLMLAMAILAHDGVHRVLFKNPFINDLASGLLSILGGGVPFYANRQYHLTHHSYTHQGEADPEHQMHNKPFWQAAIIGSFIGLYLQYKTLFRNLKRGLNGEQKFLMRAIKDMGFVLAMVLIYFVLLPLMGINPLYSIVPGFLIFPFTFAYRAMLDHYGLPKVKRKSEVFKEILENSAEENKNIVEHAGEQVSGWVVKTNRFIEWLWSNVNYHEVHHKFPYLSYIHLPAAYAETKDSYPYREADGYTKSFWFLRKQPYYTDE